MKTPEKETPQLKNDDSQPIAAGAWKTGEPRIEPEEVAPPKVAVCDHHAKAKHDDATPEQHPKPEHDDSAQPMLEKVDA
jgi:hypothetical protein